MTPRTKGGVSEDVVHEFVIPLVPCESERARGDVVELVGRVVVLGAGCLGSLIMI